jgi:uncharacterized protein YbjT (DUF2867 family)
VEKWKKWKSAEVTSKHIFVTGGTGYLGRRLATALAARGHRVRVLTRPGSVSRVPSATEAILGDALDATSYVGVLRQGETLVHLVGTPHPSPAKAAEFRRVDLPSIEAAVKAAVTARIGHLVYVSVAHPAPIMKAYIEVRVAGERAIANAALTATVLRPWYVLGPGRRWPVILLPVYAVLNAIPATRDGARRLGLVTTEQMLDALIAAVEHPPDTGTIRVLEVPEIRASAAAGL